LVSRIKKYDGKLTKEIYLYFTPTYSGIIAVSSVHRIDIYGKHEQSANYPDPESYIGIP